MIDLEPQTPRAGDVSLPGPSNLRIEYRIRAESDRDVDVRFELDRSTGVRFVVAGQEVTSTPEEWISVTTNYGDQQHDLTVVQIPGGPALADVPVTLYFDAGKRKYGCRAAVVRGG